MCDQDHFDDDLKDAEARGLVERITLALPDASMRERFLAAEPVTRLPARST